MAEADDRVVTIALVEDDAKARARLVASIRSQPWLRLSGEYASGAEALQALAAAAPDVLLVDIGLPDMSGLEVIRQAAQRHPSCDILVVTIFGDERTVLAALESGARGYLLKGALEHDVTVDIQHLREGGSPLSPMVARQVLARLTQAQAPSLESGESALTAREAEILRTIARGFSYAETGSLLAISVTTVNAHLKNVYRKLAVHSKTEAVFEAGKRGLI